jgi:hypothetical protein
MERTMLPGIFEAYRSETRRRGFERERVGSLRGRGGSAALCWIDLVRIQFPEVIIGRM